ncbi:MAG: hypothetical protein HQ495_02305 [Alphaproteobacteria bacterium]|nr:hypothetical protein [Alphaproteobacteria bacterium]
MALFRKTQTIDGHTLRGRHLTVWALYYFLLYFGAPVIGGAVVLDGALFLLFRYYFGACFGVFCLFE